MAGHHLNKWCYCIKISLVFVHVTITYHAKVKNGFLESNNALSLPLTYLNKNCVLLPIYLLQPAVQTHIDYLSSFNIFFIIFRGSTIAKIVGINVVTHSAHFEQNVAMWVFEEMIDGKKLTEIINETHENVKYLPNKKLPSNVVSILIVFKGQSSLFFYWKIYFLLLGCYSRCCWGCKRCRHSGICCPSSVYQ